MEIAGRLGCSQKTVSSDLSILAKEARENLRSYREKLPLEYAYVFSNLKQIRKEIWKIEEKKDSDDKLRMDACESIMKVNESILFVLESAGNVDFEIREGETEMAKAREEYDRLKEKAEQGKNQIEDDPQEVF